MKATDKAADKRMTSEKPITLIVMIYPPKKGQRRIVISAAPEGEMPLIFDGLFTDRHALMDRAYAGVLKREPQMVTVKDKKGKLSEDQVENDGSEVATESDQSHQKMGTDSMVSEAPIPNPSPVETGEGDAAKLNDISEPDNLPAIEGDVAAGEGVEEEDENG